MASIISLLTFGAGNAELPSSAYAGLEIVNYRPVIAFDPGSSDESVMFRGIVPTIYDNGFEVWLTYSMASANTGKTIKWSVDFENLQLSTELASDHFTGSPLSTMPTVPSVAYASHTVVLIFTHAQAGSLAVGSDFRVKVTRAASDVVNDDAAGDAYLTTVELRAR